MQLTIVKSFQWIKSAQYFIMSAGTMLIVINPATGATKGENKMREIKTDENLLLLNWGIDHILIPVLWLMTLMAIIVLVISHLEAMKENKAFFFHCASLFFLVLLGTLLAAWGKSTWDDVDTYLVLVNVFFFCHSIISASRTSLS